MAEKRIKNELDTNYRLVGMATSLKEYKLCHYLNGLLECDFAKLEPVTFEPKDRTRKVQFSVFKAQVVEDNCTIAVFANKNLGEYLLPEVSNFDYVIQITGKFANDRLKFLIEGAKQFPEVLMIAEIQPKKIKSIERLVYNEEKPATKRFNFR